jgi:hypothetical protein
MTASKDLRQRRLGPGMRAILPLVSLLVAAILWLGFTGQASASDGPRLRRGNYPAPILGSLCRRKPLSADRMAQVRLSSFQEPRLGKLRLRTPRRFYSVGQMVVFSLVNESRLAAYFGEEAFFVQRWQESTWVTEEPWYLTEPWYPYNHPVPPGAASTCLFFSLPEDQEAGRYRIVMPLTIKLSSGRQMHSSRSAMFAIR